MLESLFNSYKPSDLQLSEKGTPVQQFSCEICEIFKNNFLTEHLRWCLLLYQVTIQHVVSQSNGSILWSVISPELVNGLFYFLAFR